MSIHSTTILLTITMVFGLRAVKAGICMDSVCTFHLTVAAAKTMNYRAADHSYRPVTFNGMQPVVTLSSGLTTLTPNDFVIADGFVRDVILFNGTLPGPTIEVMEGAQVGRLITVALNAYCCLFYKTL